MLTRLRCFFFLFLLLSPFSLLHCKCFVAHDFAVSGPCYTYPWCAYLVSSMSYSFLFFVLSLSLSLSLSLFLSFLHFFLFFSFLASALRLWLQCSYSWLATQFAFLFCSCPFAFSLPYRLDSCRNNVVLRKMHAAAKDLVGCMVVKGAIT